jgi:phage terminase small subunit
MPKRGKQALTIKEKKFVAAKIAGKTNRAAYEGAGYSIASTKGTIDVAASQLNTRPNVQAAIDAGLARVGLTPEYAIEQLAKIVQQDDELGAKRLAIKDTLELHGWNKADKPQVHVTFEGDFFQSARHKVPIEAEVIEDGDKA